MNSLLNKKKKGHLGGDKVKNQDKEEAALIYAEYIRSFEPEVVEDSSTFIKQKVINTNNEDFVSFSGNKRKEIEKVENDEDATTYEPTVKKKKKKENEKEKDKEEKIEKKKKFTEVKEIDKFLEEIKHKQKIWDEKKYLQERIEQNISIEEKNELCKRLKEIEQNDIIASYYPKREMFANLFLNNLSPEVTEEFLCKKFGVFGPIHSIKIMYPRSEEEKKRNRISGFVCFENKEDAEIAKDTLNGTEILGYVVKIGWSKAIPKMTSEKSEITDLLMNLNKMKRNENEKRNEDENKCELENEHKSGIENENMESSNEKMEEILKGSVDDQYSQSKLDHKKIYKMVELSVPEDEQVREAINLLAEHVVEAGYIFEEAVKKNEKNNSLFNFLFNENEYSNYYRWRVYSFSQGDTIKHWRTDPFQIFKNGTIYIPPPLKKKIVKKDDEKKHKDVELSISQRKKLLSILENLSKKRVSICRAMIFCAKHSDASSSIVKIIADYLADVKQDLLKKEKCHIKNK